MHAEPARGSRRLPRSFGTENDPAYKGRKSTSTHPPSSIYALSVSGADPPASRYQSPGFASRHVAEWFYRRTERLNRLRVFNIANTARLGRGVGQERWLRLGPSENYVAR